MHSRSAFIVASLFCLAGGAPVSGATISWLAAEDGDYIDPDNWSANQPPGSDDTANFDVDGAYIVTLSNNVSNSRLTIRDGDVTFAMADNSYSVTGGSFSTRIAFLSFESASLTIDNGELACLDAAVGFFNSADGAVTVSGDNARWNVVRELSIAEEGAGSLVISGGGQVTYGGECSLAREFTSTGSISVSGVDSLLSGEGPLNIGELSGQSTATLSVTNSGVVEATEINLDRSGRIEGNGTVRADVTNGGSLAPGLPVGGLTIEGDYSQNIRGRLVIPIRTQVDFSNVIITGSATLDGTLEVELLDGFEPDVGDEFVILASTSRNGAFEQIEAPELSGSKSFFASYGPEIVTLRVISGSGVPGDINGDGFVDAFDLAGLLGSWGTDDPAADLNDDGTVDAFDLAELLGNWSPASGS